MSDDDEDDPKRSIRRALLEKLLTSAATGSRSSVLAPLQWLIATLAALLGVLVWRRAPLFLLIGVGGLVLALVVLFAWVYVTALRKDPEVLRSEHFKLNQILAEKLTVGDDRSGMREVAPAIYEGELADSDPPPLLTKKAHPGNDDEGGDR